MSYSLLQIIVDTTQNLLIVSLFLQVRRLNKIMVLQAKYNNSVTELFNSMFGVVIEPTEKKPEAQA